MNRMKACSMIVGMAAGLAACWIGAGTACAQEASAPAAPPVVTAPVPGPAAPEPVLRIEPETPVAMPETPVAEPETPVMEPETPVMEPETPVEPPVVVPSNEGNGKTVTVDVGGGPVTGAAMERTEGSKISITLDNVPVTEVIRMFARVTDLNMVVSANVQTNVTVSMKDVEWQPALRAILDSAGLGMTERTPGIISIVMKSEIADEPIVADTIFLKYTTTETVLPAVTKMVSTNGSVTALSAANALVLMETASRIGVIKENIEMIDQPRPQVFIEAKFVELNDQAIKDIGINWQALQGYQVGVSDMLWSTTENRNRLQLRNNSSSQWDRRSNVDTVDQLYDMYNRQYEDRRTSFEESPPGSGNFIATTTIEPTREIVDTIDLGRDYTRTTQDNNEFSSEDVRTAVLSAADFGVVLSALKQNNGVSVVSNPKIIVSNGETAEIHVGERRPNIVRRTSSTQGGTAETIYEFGTPNWIDIGAKVSVTPTVNTESNITVKIIPELDRQIGSVEPTPGLTFPVLVTRRVETEFALESGKTAAIGGLIQNSDEERVSKIPLLGDIPLLGKYLFSHTHKEKRQDEIVIFVTVSFVTSGEIKEAQGIPLEGELIHRYMADRALRDVQRSQADEPVKLR